MTEVLLADCVHNNNHVIYFSFKKLFGTDINEPTCLINITHFVSNACDRNICFCPVGFVMEWPRKDIVLSRQPTAEDIDLVELSSCSSDSLDSLLNHYLLTDAKIAVVYILLLPMFKAKTSISVIKILWKKLPP